MCGRKSESSSTGKHTPKETHQTLEVPLKTSDNETSLFPYPFLYFLHLPKFCGITLPFIFRQFLKALNLPLRNALTVGHSLGTAAPCDVLPAGATVAALPSALARSRVRTGPHGGAPKRAWTRCRQQALHPLPQPRLCCLACRVGEGANLSPHPTHECTESVIHIDTRGKGESSSPRVLAARSFFVKVIFYY